MLRQDWPYLLFKGFVGALCRRGIGTCPKAECRQQRDDKRSSIHVHPTTPSAGVRPNPHVSVPAQQSQGPGLQQTATMRTGNCGQSGGDSVSKPRIKPRTSIAHSARPTAVNGPILPADEVLTLPETAADLRVPEAEGGE
jgi:hypothetical protein